jgi:hypothetical protein
MNFWRAIDFLALGSAPFFYRGRLDVETVRTNIQALTELSDSNIGGMRLVAALRGDRVRVWYEVSPERGLGPAPGNLGALSLFRPIFFGTLAEFDAAAEVRGWFGIGWIARVFGASACIEVLAYGVSWLLQHPIELTGPTAFLPLAFTGMAIVTRINAGDDIPFIQKNLRYALDGDD